MDEEILMALGSVRRRRSGAWARATAVCLLATCAGGCAWVVGADFDVTARPNDAPPSGIEGPSVVASWRLTAPQHSDTQYLGLSVAVEGDTALVGARNTGWTGQVFVVKRGFADAWDIDLNQTLTAGQYAAPDAEFGSSVAMSGDWAVVGASGPEPTMDHPQNPPPGSAYFFHRVDGQWSMSGPEIKAPTPVDGDRFGIRVAMEDGVAVIGAPGATDGSTGPGTVYVYNRAPDGTWSLSPPPLVGGEPGDAFGTELAVRSTTLVIGAPNDDEAGVDAGAAYTFERSGASWVPISGASAKLVPRSLPAPGHRFGLGTIGLDDGLLIVPALSAPSGYQVSAYERSASGEWAPTALDPPRGLAAESTFGWRAAVRGSTAIIAVRTGVDVGMGLFYRRTAGAWKFEKRLESSASNSQDIFGWTIAYDGSTACFGAIFFGDREGAVYFFDLSP